MADDAPARRPPLTSGARSAAVVEGNLALPQNPARAASSSARPDAASVATRDAADPTAVAIASAVAPLKPPAGKKKRHRAGRKRKNRHQSFVNPSEADDSTVDGKARPSVLDAQRINANQASFYRLQAHRDRSNTSLESEALLDHRGHARMRSRRDTLKQSLGGFAMPFARQSQSRPSDAGIVSSREHLARSAYGPEIAVSDGEDDGAAPANDRTPLLSNRLQPRNKAQHSRASSTLGNGTGHTPRRRFSTASWSSSRRKADYPVAAALNNYGEELRDVNNPPSVPGSPTIGSLDDMFLASAHSDRGRETVIDIQSPDDLDDGYADSPSPEGMRRRPTGLELAERDVCFPGDEEDEDEEDEEEEGHRDSRRDASTRRRRRRTRVWPDLDILEEWSREEKEERTQQEVQRAKKISEPVMVGGRLRPVKTIWHREEDDSPFRFTYFNETLDGTIHARTISDLQDDMTFRDLFLPDPLELSDDSDDDDDADVEDPEEDTAYERPSILTRASSEAALRPEVAASVHGNDTSGPGAGKPVLPSAPPSGIQSPQPKQKRYGARPTYWLDVLKPTETEMKVLSRAFGIHQLTAEDILMDEPREKVELFPTYYFVNYRTFEQDKDSEDYMLPINMYVIVFRFGVITFHHSMSPHPANVRRRIRQLNDYLSPSPDWVSYAIIDDVTDVYAPLVAEIEQEVDEIDEDILYMHTTAADNAVASKAPRVPSGDSRPKSSRTRKGGNHESEPQTQADIGAIKAEGDKTAGESGGDMLRRVGECRKKVMSLYRLLGNKADVIKGFAKRCNEHWEVAPRSEIGLYLGDIQDHIVTMTGNLSHFESLLSRAHGNYVAQINIRMNERAEQNADVLGKLTVLGTIVLPMNIITGMWGMNVWVPGQEYEGDLTWFFCITAGLVAFGLACYFIAKKVYRIV